MFDVRQCGIATERLRESLIAPQRLSNSRNKNVIASFTSVERTNTNKGRRLCRIHHLLIHRSITTCVPLLARGNGILRQLTELSVLEKNLRSNSNTVLIVDTVLLQ